MGCMLPVGRNGCVGCVGCLLPLLLPLLLLMGALALAPQVRTGSHVFPAQAKPAIHASDAADCQIIVDRYRLTLLEAKQPDLTPIRGWVATLNAQGEWPDIDYHDQHPAVWRPLQHLQRVSILARALTDPRSPLLNDTGVERATMRALDMWCARRYQASNWYFNQIGVPMLMRDIAILLDARLTGERRKGALAVWHQYGHIAPGNGANTLWTAELALEYGAYAGDTDLVTAESEIIKGEIKYTTGEGVQPDFSFHQHGARLQQFHYGGAFIADAARLAWELHGTKWALPGATIRIITDTVLQGSQWMCRGVRTVPGTIDRAVSRPDSMGADMRGAAKYLRFAAPQYAPELDALIARQNGQGHALVGFRSYPRSDFSVYQRPKFSFFLKTISSRTQAAEQGMNGENLLGQYLSGGDHYLLRDGDEYYNLQPVWDWHLLPGITWADGAGSLQKRAFSGSIGDGDDGATAMDYALGSPTTPTLTAHKFWACEGDAVVCLISNLRTHGLSAPTRTALDQCRLRGAVTVGEANGTVTSLSAGMPAPRAARWIHHAGFAYIPLGGCPVSVRMGMASGSWYEINHGASPAPVTAPVFMPLLEQGVSPGGTSSGFAIAPCETPQAAAAAADRPAWHILANTPVCQSVQFNDGVLMAVFYQPGTLRIDGKNDDLIVDRPCLLLRSKGLLRACDPTQNGGIVHVARRDGTAVATIAMPSGGRTSEPF